MGRRGIVDRRPYDSGRRGVKNAVSKRQKIEKSNGGIYGSCNTRHEYGSAGSRR